MQPLIILGASARGAAASAVRAFFQPYAIDLYADEDLRQMAQAVRIERFPGDFAEALAAAPQAPWIFTGGLENHPRLVDRLAKLRPLLGNSGSVLQAVRNPAKLARVMAEHGLAYPPTVLPGNSCHVGAADQWLIKPLRGSAGLFVRQPDGSERGLVPRGYCWQRLVEGQSCSAVFVAAGGQARLLGTSRQIIGQDWDLARPFLYVGSIGPLEISPSEQQKLVRLGNVLAREFRLVGLFNVDLVRTPSELWVVEVNPRYSASVEVLERVTGKHFLNMHVAACELGELPAELPAPKPGLCAGKAVVYARAAGQATPALFELVKDWNQPSTWPQIADIPAPGQPIFTGQPVVTVFAEGGSPEQARQQLRERANFVQTAIDTS